MNILILTTALNRSELHSKTFRDYRVIIEPSDKVTWVINIDFIEKLGEDVKVTKQNIEAIFQGYNIDFIFFKGKAWFNGAVKRITEEAKKHVHKSDVILYLEDDWVLKNKIPSLRKLIKRDVGEDFKNRDFMICLSERIFLTNDWINMQPQLWSRSMFILFIMCHEQDNWDDGSPELRLVKYFKHYDTSKVIKTRYRFFGDFGRRWMLNNGLRKKSKYSENYAGKSKSIYK